MKPVQISASEEEKSSEATLFDKLKWMTSKEAAFYIRVSVGQLRNMVYRGQLTAYRLGSSRLRFLRTELDALLSGSSGTNEENLVWR